MVTRFGLLAAGAAVLVASACSSSPTTPAPSPAPSSETSSAAPTAPAGACPDGAYRVTALEGRGSASALGKGSGGDIDASFSDGDFTISSDGADPVKVDLGPVNADMRFNGKITGTYEGDSDALRLTTTSADGEVTVKGFGFTRSRSASALSGQLLGQGVTAQVVCDDAAGTAVVTLPNAALTLTRA
ncbi:hypothetical protein SAMN04488544_3916 [Microlunatus sagamiharensis]|uniref:Lipoprotein n=1 Tax=Microlunatus sagamiharensis TaxID=546874 RepID=A0A1H2NF69_9ACTN|nr:hypothetical protein [Microlunatus sagamiharensis]SDV04109.1 hypothetical protein SAMN04488544_3916 [Microlunatus sagamiharensis]